MNQLRVKKKRKKFNMQKAIIISLGVLIGIAGILTIGAHLAAATQLALYEQDEEDENGTQSK